jgi:threonine dehydrogenase-like Zn-dependent dehydrogenase
MQQLNYIKAGLLEWHEVPPTPSLPDDDAVLVRPLTVSTCDFDGVVLSGLIPMKGPLPFGHEGEGVVIDAGQGVRRFKMGDRVIIPWKIACGSCVAGGRGHTAQCSTVPPEDSYSWGPRADIWGGFVSDAVVVPWADQMLTVLPPDIDPIQACGVADNISDGSRAVAPHLAAKPGGSVLVTGGLPPGSIRLYAAGLAKSLGASRAVYASPSAKINAIAAQMGCQVIDTKAQALNTIKDTFVVTVDSSGDPAALPHLLRLTGSAGVCTSVHSTRSLFAGPID